MVYNGKDSPMFVYPQTNSLVPKLPMLGSHFKHFLHEPTRKRLPSPIASDFAKDPQKGDFSPAPWILHYTLWNKPKQLFKLFCSLQICLYWKTSYICITSLMLSLSFIAKRGHKTMESLHNMQSAARTNEVCKGFSQSRAEPRLS